MNVVHHGSPIKIERFVMTLGAPNVPVTGWKTFEGAPQLAFRPERMIVTCAIAAKGLLAWLCLKLLWVMLPHLQRVWDDWYQSAVDDEDDLENSYDTLPEIDTPDHTARRRWRLSWYRPFGRLHMRLGQKERTRALRECVVTSFEVAGYELLVQPVPLLMLSPEAFPLQLDAPTCKPGDRIRVTVCGEAPPLTVVLIGMGMPLPESLPESVPWDRTKN